MKWTEQQQPNRDARAATLLRLLLAIAGGASFAWLSRTTPERRELPDNTVANASHDRRAKDGNAISASGGPFRAAHASKRFSNAPRVASVVPTDDAIGGLPLPAIKRQPLIPPKGDQASLTPAARSAARTANLVASAAPADTTTGRSIQSAGLTPHPNPRAPPIVAQQGKPGGP